VVGVYFSPNRDLAQFSAYLDRLATVIRRQLPGPVLVAGDLNSKSVDWSSPATDARGQVLVEWGAELGFGCSTEARLTPACGITAGPWSM